MESMRRSEANSSHHPNKVAVNSLATESNKHSSGSGSLNKNKLSLNQQQSASSHQQQQQQPQQPNQSQQKSSSSSSAGSFSSSSTTSSSSSSAASSSSESKDTNFEYDDNEWDVGGIGDLIIDLDADIEKSSSTAVTGNNASAQQQQSQNQHQQLENQTQLSSTLSAAISDANSGGGGSSKVNNNNNHTQLNILNANEKSPEPSSSSTSSSSSPTTISPSKSSTPLYTPIPLRQGQNSSKQSNITASPSTSSGSNKQNSKQISKVQQSLKLQQPALVAQLNSKCPPTHQRLSSLISEPSIKSRNLHSTTANQSVQIDRQNNLLCTSVSMSSQPGSGQAAGKAATKMSIDHQATLDKGLKMKIKRTKPGTKTSEAKHEIVKAEQNGTSSNVDDSPVSGNSSSSNKKHNQINATTAVQPMSAQQATKRGSSGHRRDKTRDKTPHSRDKSEHSNNGNGSNSNSNSSNSSNNSANIERTSCTCSHENQINGTQSSCTNTSCIRNRTSTSLDQSSNTPLAQRIPVSSSVTNQTNSSNSVNSNSSNSSNSSTLSSGSNSSTNSMSSFSTNSVSNTTTTQQISSSSTTNSPGPPKDNKLSGNAVMQHHQQSTSQVSPTPQISLSSVQPQQQQQQPQQQQSNQTSLSSLSAVHCSSQNMSGSVKSNIGNMSSQSTSISATVHHTISVTGNTLGSGAVSNCDERSCSPPAKRSKCDPKDMVDICIGTSVGTITEPDCLGPCEPGTSVTLEGIVWHETEGGVLVVNVTWRGKTYVGTLLDCTRHDWAPPRFCDSPTEELDSRTPKGRGKRGRSAALTPDLSNFTETRSSVHSKLRNGGAKGRGGRGVTTTASATSTTTTCTASSTTSTTSTTLITVSSNTSGSTTGSNTPSTSPTAFLPPRSEKRKSKDESPSPVNGEPSQTSNHTQSLVNPVTGLNVQISTKKCKTASPCAISPVLLECPEQDCSKKYKHANGLRYHQSHAHGSGSMDEDSLQLPESPRAAAPTTPSPVPATPTTQIPTSVSNVNNMTNTGLNSAPVTPSSQQTTTSVSPPSPISPICTSSIQQSSTVTTAACNNNSSGGLLTTVQTSTPTAQITQQPPLAQQTQALQHPMPGGSITAGVSSQALSQHQQHSILAGSVPTSITQGNNQMLSESQSLSQQSQQQQQQSQQHAGNNGVSSNSSRNNDNQTKIKPGVLRFGPPSDNAPSTQSPHSVQGSVNRNASTGAMAPNSGPPSTPESAHQPPYIQPQPSGQSGMSVNKASNFGKQKKNRKSPVPGEFDNTTSRDDVQSPAYSDISDDSTPVVDSDLSDKPQTVKHTDIKKVQEGPPPSIPPLGGYSMYQFYSQQPYMVPPEHQTAKAPSSQSSLPPASPSEYNKTKEPPLDLITKPVQSSNEPSVKEATVPTVSAPTGAPNQPTKPISHFYPYNYIPPGYSYNMDPNYGPVSMVTEENKLGQVQNTQSSLKEERTKENPSPNDHHGKMSGQVIDMKPFKYEVMHQSSQLQMIPTKLIKSEQPAKEIIKSEPNNSHSMHPKEQPIQQQSLSGYPGLYQRHSMPVPPQPQQHLSREDDLRRYYIYSDQRRSSSSSGSSVTNVPSVSVKEESSSPSQQSLQHTSGGSLSQSQQQMSQMNIGQQNQSQQSQNQNSSQQQQQQQKGIKSNLSSSQMPSSQKPTNLIKDVKEEKEVKIKQEGQKPTMETQGPPPPPTSQYFLHPSYISPSPFGFDPGHPMYRNVLMSANPYNTPPYHHLPMARFHAPEDLSRNPSTKALDALHHAASQYYNNHKIHELSERALKSPNNNVKVSVSSSPNVSQQSGSNSNNNSNSGGGGILPSSSVPSGGGPLNLQPPSGSMPPGSIGGNSGTQKNDGKSNNDPSGKPGVVSGPIGGTGPDSRSPPPQRHVHTHHHTHVGLGYPMYPAPYGAAVLASQQAAAVAVINPFPPGSSK